MAEEGNKKTVTIAGENYTLQHPGVRWYIKHTDRCRDKRGNLSQEKYIDGLLENVVIQNISMDDFDEKGKVGALYDLVEAIESFLGAQV